MRSLISHSRPTITHKDEDALLEVLHSEMIARGSKVVEFESKVANYLGLNNGIATSSGTSALFLSLKALGVGKGDEVIIPTYVCPTVLCAVENTGATPVLCDVSNDWNMDYYTVQPHLTPKTKAIVAPHIYGIPIDIKPLTELGVPIIEDLAQAFGAEIDGRKTGTFGQLAMCSFQATKCLTTCEGGMVLSNNDDYIEKIRYIQSLAPMSDLQAALGIIQLEQYESFLQRRRKIAGIYFKKLDKFPNICMPLALRKRSIFFRFPLKVPLSFDMLKAEFEQKDIAVRQGVDSLLHRIIGLPSKDFPNAERCFKETLCIPIYPALSDNQVECIAKMSEQILSQHLSMVGDKP